MRYGPSKLSIKPTANIPQTARPPADRYCPVVIKYINAGIKIIDVQTLGINAPNAAINPNKTALSNPKSHNPIAVSIP